MALAVRTLENFVGGSWVAATGDSARRIVSPVTGETVAEAFDAMYHLERAARQLVLAYQTGRELAIMSDEVAEATAAEWEVYKEAEHAHFAEMKRILDHEDPSYAD